MKSFFLVFIGGGFGSVVRFLIGYLFQKTSLTLPLATFIANLSACVVFALVFILMQNKPNLNESLRLLLVIGFCGGLSTFSTFSYENYQLLKQSAYLIVVANIVFSTGLCILVFYWLGR